MRKYIVDLIGTMKEIPETFEGGYKRVDIVADTYQEITIKSVERKD